MWSFRCCQLRFAQHTQTWELDRKVDRIPNNWWFCSWQWNADGELPTPTFDLELLLTFHPQPIVAIQNTLKPELSSIAMSLVVFSQTFGGALFLSFDQTTFSNGLSNALHQYAPEVDAAAVINAGATGFRSIVDKSSVDGVILAYSQAISHVFYIGAGTAVGGFIFCWGMGWKSIKKPKVVSPEA